MCDLLVIQIIISNFHDCSIAAHDNCLTIIWTCVRIAMASLEICYILNHFQRYRMLRSKSCSTHLLAHIFFVCVLHKNVLIFHIIFELETIESSACRHKVKNNATVVIVSSCKNELSFKIQPPKWRIERNCMKWLDGKICKVRSENKESL